LELWIGACVGTFASCSSWGLRPVPRRPGPPTGWASRSARTRPAWVSRVVAACGRSVRRVGHVDRRQVRMSQERDALPQPWHAPCGQRAAVDPTRGGGEL